MPTLHITVSLARMFTWWFGLPWPLRLGIALLFLAISTILYFVGYLWPWGWGIGSGLLLFSLPQRDLDE